MFVYQRVSQLLIRSCSVVKGGYCSTIFFPSISCCSQWKSSLVMGDFRTEVLHSWQNCWSADLFPADLLLNDGGIARWKQCGRDVDFYLWSENWLLCLIPNPRILESEDWWFLLCSFASKEFCGSKDRCPRPEQRRDELRGILVWNASKSTFRYQTSAVDPARFLILHHLITLYHYPLVI